MTTPRRINADVFRRARKAGAPLDLAAYVARPPVLDLTFEYDGNVGENAEFETDGRRFRAHVEEPEGGCDSCAELVDAFERQDEGIAWMTPDEFAQTDHRVLAVEEINADGDETGHGASLYGVCSRRMTEVDRLTDDRYLAETVADLAAEAAGYAETAERKATEHADQTRGITIDRETLEAWAGRALTGDEVERIDDALQHSSVPEAVATIASSLTDEPHTLTFHSTITGEEGPVTMTVRRQD